MTDPRLIALSSNPGQVEPGPFSEHDLREQWNAQANEFNQWESLDLSEQLAWAQTRAVVSFQLPRLARLMQEPTAFELGDLPPPVAANPVNLAELRDPDFSDGLTPSQHLDVLRGGPDPRVPQKERPDFQEGYRAGLADGRRLHGGPDPRAAATASPGLPKPEADRVLRLAQVIREADPADRIGGWAHQLAQALLAHPDFSGCHDGPAAPPAPGFQIGPQEYIPDLKPASEAQGVLADRYEFSVIDSEDCEQAGGSAPTLDDAIREGRNYLRQYSQDGPHKLELRRVLVLDHSEATDDHA
jgi:hypothetical protein